jgi:hypothetical protein
MLFDPEFRFRGLPAEGFRVFEIPDRDRRRKAIVDRFHPALRDLADDLLLRLDPGSDAPLHPHLPRLDWPRGYEPFCTWLALSRLAQGYQAGPQLNVGVHRSWVGARLGWDVHADAFGRFEFLCRCSDVGEEMVQVATDIDLRFRVYASAPWPEGSREVFSTTDDLATAFEEVRQRGVWFELGTRWDLPACEPIVTSSELGKKVLDVFRSLLPLHDRIAGR